MNVDQMFIGITKKVQLKTRQLKMEVTTIQIVYFMSQKNLKAHWQLSEERYCSCDKTCQFAAL